MISRKNKISSDIKKKKTSNVSLLFRFITGLSIFPINVDYDKRTLTFSFFSKKMFIYTIYSSSVPIIGTFLPTFIIGYSKVKSYYDTAFSASSATDNISMFGTFGTFALMGAYFVLFMKKLGRFSSLTSVLL